MSRRIRVLLADDHRTVREGIRALLEPVLDIEVVGEAGTSGEALEMTARSAPDVVVLDISMPDQSGLSIVSQLATAHPHVRVLILTRHHDPLFVQQALAEGAAGYVLKQSPFSELRRAIGIVAMGASHVDARVVPRELAETFGAVHVSNREWDVLRRSAIGQGNKEIAAALGIAVKTVEVHKANAMRKLGLRDRAGLIRYASARGWLSEA